MMYNSALVFNPSNGTSKKFQFLFFRNWHLRTFTTFLKDKACPNGFPLHQLDIPITDLEMFFRDSNDLCRQTELEKLGIACKEWGFCQVVNHGIPLSLMERMKGIVRDFIKLPLEEKLKYQVQEFEGYGQTFVTSDDQILDWADNMYLTTLPPENRKMNLWPTMPVDFRYGALQFTAKTQQIVPSEGLQRLFLKLSAE